MGQFSLPTQLVVCPKCKEDYYDDHKKQTCPYCEHKFEIKDDE